MVLVAQVLSGVCLFYDRETISDACCIPLATLPLIGFVYRTVWLIFFRGIAESEAYKLSVIVVILLSMSCFSSFQSLYRLIQSNRNDLCFMSVVGLTMISCVAMFECPVLVLSAIYLMAIGVMAGGGRGLLWILLMGTIVLLIGEFSTLFEDYLSKRCLSSVANGRYYRLWSIGVTTLSVWMWWRCQSSKKLQVRIVQ